jgi:hypothetical protein
MEPVSGFMSFDGKFFSSSDACRSYEERQAHLSGLAVRCKAVVDDCVSGVIFSEKGRNSSSLPKELLVYLGTISEDDFTDLWNEHLMHLFVDSEGPIHEKPFSILPNEIPHFDGVGEAAEHWDFFVLKAETAYKLLAFVLGKPL